ncbi:unnamed protein product [Linum trigynum]|uniref:Protein FAR1-RELATED SEQUENCE n=1 Tax=Linum trigynum TaxID=586398 RepID=A0AAV2FHN8_9ROSI
MGFGSSSNLFTNAASKEGDPDPDPDGEWFGGNVNVKPYSVGKVGVMNNTAVDGDGVGFEPYIGLEFDSPDDAREFYNKYAMHVGFRTRIGQLYRSRTDGSVASRRYVCQREGFQLNSRTGCPAFIRVQKHGDSGKWVIDQMEKNHNHEFLGGGDESCSPILQGRISVSVKPSSVLSPRPKKPKVKLLKEIDGGGINAKRFRSGSYEGEPYSGLVFNSADEAYHFYHAYAEKAGFRVRIGQLFRSKNDGSITSRRFVCSKEGFQHPSRLGCGAFMRIKRQDFGTWIVDRLEKNHNHETGLEPVTPKRSMDEVVDEFVSPAPATTLHCGQATIKRENEIGSEWYSLLLDYFQTRQAQDTGFFYSLEVDSNGSCKSIFWADGRSRFSCSQFGDAIILDTSYRKKKKTRSVVPFAMFLGVNHHRQPVILGCALIADESSKETFTWLFNTWLNAMFGRSPRSIIADQDPAIQQAVAQVFPSTRHRFSLWQLEAREQEKLRSMSDEFRYGYDECISQSQTPAEFTTMWTALVNCHGLGDNVWLQEMYEKRESWVPLYLRGSFFAGISLTSSFSLSTSITESEVDEFISRYEQVVEHQRKEEMKEDFKCSNLQAVLKTKDPVEDQCRQLYTLAVFKIFQEEMLQCYNYFAIKTFEERTVSRFSLQRCGDESEKHTIRLDRLNLDIDCSCRMFEFEGVLCRHALRVFNLLGIRELPSRYILHRWTKNAEYGTPRDVESLSEKEELKALMTWSLREAASSYVEASSGSLDQYRASYEVMHEAGRKKLP